MRKCPRCGLLSADEADLCDCSYRFSTDAVEGPQPHSLVKASGSASAATYGVVYLINLIFAFYLNRQEFAAGLSAPALLLQLPLALGLSIIPFLVCLLSRNETATYVALALSIAGVLYGSSN